MTFFTHGLLNSGFWILDSPVLAQANIESIPGAWIKQMAVFMLVSIFGFSDSVGHVQNGLDPSRVAAQIVSGIGKGMLPRSHFAPSEIRIVYFDGRGLLREALSECARRGFSISDLEIKHESDGSHNGDARHVTVDIEVRGQGSIAALASELNDLDGVVSVFAGDANQLSY